MAVASEEAVAEAEANEKRRGPQDLPWPLAAGQLPPQRQSQMDDLAPQVMQDSLPQLDRRSQVSLRGYRSTSGEGW